MSHDAIERAARRMESMVMSTDDEVRALVERLQERLTLRYMGDCKCGKCQLVPGDLVCEAATMLSRLIAERAEVQKVQPVAWIRDWHFKGNRCRDDLTDDAEVAEIWRDHPQTNRIIPLYPHPPTDPQKVRDEALEDALREATFWRANSSALKAIRDLKSSPTDTIGGE